ncbi:MAG: secretion protein HylD [Rhodospirillaceae bacterium]|jgi:adhesin transport system membrane fusion protein|nr:secretion protein HylD [Rhodospirillaceae bacterium]|tara:strand:- start:2894 stop:4213 length:1320 start_codon:yes stop_codon:yes gene_type:complete
MNPIPDKLKSLIGTKLPEDDGERGTHLFFALCATLVLAFFIWSAVGRLDVVSVALGEVIPSSQVKSIQHLEGGIVREILVREGDAVKQGQPLVNLEPLASGADVEELMARVTSLRAGVARLEAEARGAKAPVFPEDLVQNHPELVKEATALFDTRRSRIRNQLAGQRQQIAQQERMIDEVTARLGNNRHRLTLLSEQIGISEQLLKEQLSNRMQHLNLLKEAAGLKGRIGEDTAALKRTQAARKEALNKLGSIRDAFREKAQEDLEKKRREFEEFSNRLRKYEDSLKRTVLRSPVDGVVKTLYVVTIGGVVAPGATVADVVPAGDRLIIEARLPTQDIGYVHPGQTALVMLASADAIRFGNIEGKVVHVSPDAIDSAGGAPFYKVRIAMEKDFFERRGVKYRLVPGVLVMSSIRTGQRSVLAYLTDPFRGSFQTALRER